MTSDWEYYRPRDTHVSPKGLDAGEFAEIEWRESGYESWIPINPEENEWYPAFNYRYRLKRRVNGPGDALPYSGNPLGLNSLPEDDATRNEFPMFDGLLAYFPNALAEVARVSKIGNDQHNPGEPMHWARGKSTDHLNKIVRHIIDAGKKDARGVRHSARLVWRALANLQEELEREEGFPLPVGAKAA